MTHQLLRYLWVRVPGQLELLVGRGLLAGSVRVHAPFEPGRHVRLIHPSLVESHQSKYTGDPVRMPRLL
nr:hypothetical protein CFP56_44083 [Quercus suber]